MHIGKLIRDVVQLRGMTVVCLASKLSCSRANVYKIFDKKSIDTDMLIRISSILEYDFFLAISDNEQLFQSVDMSTDWQHNSAD